MLVIIYLTVIKYIVAFNYCISHSPVYRMKMQVFFVVVVCWRSQDVMKIFLKISIFLQSYGLYFSAQILFESIAIGSTNPNARYCVMCVFIVENSIFIIVRSILRIWSHQSDWIKSNSDLL